MENKGRLRYVEPTNLSNGTKNGTLSDFIQYPYEDYSMAVDLSIRMTNRYSCGLGDTNGEYEDLSYSSEKGTLSFLGGTKVGKNSSEQGFLTTNYTDIKMTKGDGYTSECLGIESIQIQYNSWMYPQVTIRFVDVRGATVMHPAEEGYYSRKDIGSSSSIYRALFSFPYPVFTLKVKGFYGKGVTYKLAVQKTNMEFDANSGSFIITATFIGYMYGIYADMPMSYLALAPFMDGGRQYWKNKIADGTFRFKDSNGNDQCDMLTFPELRRRVAEASANMEHVSKSKANEYDNAIYLLTRLAEQFPLDRFVFTWKGKKMQNSHLVTSNGIYCTSKDEIDNYKNEVREYLSLITEAKAVVGPISEIDGVERMLNDILHEYNGENANNLKGLFVCTVSKNKNGEFIINTPHSKIKEIVTNNLNLISKYIADGKKWYVWVCHVNIDKTGIASFKESVEASKKTYKSKKDAEEERYKSETALAIEKALGFRPSIRNIYELIFAHMDTFMRCFYGRMQNIKDQLESDKTKRAKSTFGVGDGDTDTEREFETNRDGTPSITRNTSAPSRAAYLPPWAAYYKTTLENGSPQKVVRYPSELQNGETLEEVKFIADMLSAATLYNTEDNNASEAIKKIEDAVASGSDRTFINGNVENEIAPSSRVNNFVPLTPYDMVYKDSMLNPYASFYDEFSKNNNSKTLISNIIATFALRAYYFICSQGEYYAGAAHSSTYGAASSSNGVNNAKSFGDIEALNFYKAIENKNNTLFQRVIEYYKDNSEELIAQLESEGNNEFSSAWQFNGEATNNSLFKEESGAVVYNFHNAKDKYYPTEFENIKEIYGYYVVGGYDKDNRKFVKYGQVDTALTMDGLYDTVSASTFKMFEGASYLTDLGNSVSEMINEMSTVFNATDSECSKISDSVLSDYKQIAASTDTAVTFYGGVITDANEESMDKESISAVIYSGADSSSMYIKYPSQCSREGVTYYHHPIFGEALYKEQDNYGKAFLFLESLPKTPKTKTANSIIKLDVDGICSKIDLLRAGAYLWRAAQMKEGEDKDPIKWDKLTRGDIYKPNSAQTLHAPDGIRISGPNTVMNIGTVHESYARWEIESVSDSKDMKQTLIRMFMEWVEDNGEYGFAGNVASLENKKLYTNLNFDEGLNISGLASLSETNITDNKEIAQHLQGFLRNLFFSVYTTIDLYKKIGKEGGFTCPRNMMRSAIGAFCSRLNQIYNTDAKEYTGMAFNDDNDKDSALQSTRDVKLSTYLALKSLYDKWLCGPPKGFDKTWALQKERSDSKTTTNGSDFDNFVYVDSLYHDIGYDLTANITKVSEWLSSVLPTSNKSTSESVVGDTNKSVYQFLAQIAQDCGGMLLALPCRFGMQSDENISAMFKPHGINSNWDEEQSSFVFMYTYKPSEHLGEPENSNIDMNGWSPRGDGYNLTDEDISGELFAGDGRTVPAFGVTFAKQNQAFFTNIQLNTENAGVTEASLAAQFNIASKAGEGPRESSLYGQDLYRVYSQYSYKCGVEAMGNMQIMPLMYFQLNNIPLWKGAYMITKVSHAITAGEIKTNFEGVRVNRYSIPLADGAVITVKDTGTAGSNSSSNYELNEYTCMVAEHTSMVNMAKDTQYTNAAVSTVQDFDEKKVTRETPLICITPGHGPNTEKKAEWAAMSNLIDKYLIPMLSNMTYANGMPYNIQRCNKNGANALGNGYSMKETAYYVRKCGSDSVISLSIHWNGGKGSRHEIYLNKDSIGWRADSKKMAQYLLDSINETAKRGRNGEYSLMPEGMMRQTNSIKALGEENTDGGPNQSCACALLENWFADYSTDKDVAWDGSRYTDKDEMGRFKTGRAWIESEEGGKVISEAIVKGLKRYIDSLSD